MGAVRQESYADVEQLLTTGLEHYLKGRLKEAAAAFHEALWLDPGNEQARNYLRTTLGAPTTEIPSPSGAKTLPPVTTGWDVGDSAQQVLTIPDDATQPAPLLDHLKLPQSRPPPTAKNQKDRAQVETLLKEARSFEALGDFTSALDRCDKLLAVDATHAEALALQQHCTQTLIQMYESQIGPRDCIPYVAARQDEMIWLNLDHRAGFVLAQIDGQVTYDDLYAVCGMSQLDTAKVLSELLAQNIIRTRARATTRGRLR